MTALTTAASALRVEEVRRMRDLLRVGALIAPGVLVALLLLPGDRRLAWALCAAIGVAALGSALLGARLRDRYDPRLLTALAFVCVACGQLAILYVGVFSAAPLVVALGLYVFCRTEHRGSAIAIYALAAGAHAIEATLVLGGLVADPGFYPIGSHASLQAQLAGQVMMQFGYALCFWLARVTRRTSLRSIDQLRRATRLAAQREIQVSELRRELDRVLEIGGPGRFTGQHAGNWELGTVIGRGSMGEVYEAGDEVAIKVLRRELLGDARNLERFAREVRVASAIESPHVVRVLGAATDEPFPYLAMERLRGRTLAELLRETTLDHAAVAELVTQTCRALELARAAGIVHRDLSPRNLFRTDDGTWKLLDFGIAMLSELSSTLTAGQIVGTPAYMAPEQARGATVDHRADVYALAAVVYRCLTGRAPFVASDTPALLYLVVHEMPRRPDVPPAVEQVLLVGLAKSPDARFASAAELATAFTAAVAGPISDELARRAAALSWQ